MACRYKRIRLLGPVDVEPRPDAVRRNSLDAKVVVLIGPIGAGKSSFVQSLAAKTPGGSVLQIAKDQLEGATTEINIYEVQNVSPKIYLVDTPGSADEKISELAITEMLRNCIIERVGAVGLVYLYFHPINRIRVAKTLQRGLSIFQASFQYQLGWNKKRRFALVTTMWDQLFTPEQNSNAETRLIALQEQYWKEFKGKGSYIVKFGNTQESALQILDKVLQLRWYASLTRMPRPSAHTRQGQLLHDALLERIESIRQQIQFIEQEFELDSEAENHEVLATFTDPEEGANANQLKDLMLSRKRELIGHLQTYEQELFDFQEYTSNSAAPAWMCLRMFS